MNTTTNTPINTEKKTRGRPRIHETINDLWKQTDMRRKERDPEAYRAHAHRKREPIYCAICDKTYNRLCYPRHLDKRNHLKALAKKMEEHIENSQILEDNLVSFNEKIAQVPIVC